MLRICIPVHNEATTIGVLLWRLRAVFQGFSREYDVVVYDDASTDGTADVLEPYRSVMPLTVLHGGTHHGYAASIDALVRHVAAEDDYARRDAMVLLQGDFTESPEHLPELVKRFEGGADLVAVHRTVSDATPADERRLRRWGRWAVKPFLRLPPVADPFTGFRLVRISVLRDLLKAMGNRPVCAGEGWAANIDFALNVTPFARRIENVEFAPRYDVRQRASRRRGWPDVVALFHWARAARRTARPTPGARLPDTPRAERSEPALVSAPLERGQRAAPSERERDRNERRPRPERGGRGAGRDVSDSATPVREERQPREARGAREERALRGEDRPPRGEERTRGKPDRPPRDPQPREARPPRPERAPQERAPQERAPVERAAKPPMREPATTAAELASIDESVDETLLDAADGADVEETAAEGAADGAATKKSRRRRRRSRRARGEKGAEGGEPGDAESSSAGDDSGTSDGGAGQDDDGSDTSDDGGPDEPGSDGATDGGARRKRRPRRRRRGRRPGTGDGGDAPDSTSPAAEPPAA